MPDGMTQAAPTVDFLNDPDFHQLPLNEKHAAMLELDPDYKALPAKEQAAALNEIHYGGQTQFEKERDPNNQSGFAASAAGTVGRQLKSAFESTVAPYTKGYETYAAGRKKGDSVGRSLAGGLARGALAAFPTGDPLEQAQHGLQAPQEFKQRSAQYNPVYAAVAPLAAEGTGVDLNRMEHEADIGHTAGVLAEAGVPAAEALGGAAFHAGEEASRPWRNERRIKKGTERVNTALDTPGGKGGKRAEDMTRSLGDTKGDLAEIQREAPAEGSGAEAFHKFAEKVSERREKMWDEGHKPGIDRHGEAPVNNDELIAAGRQAITQEAREAAPSEAEAADKFLDSISRERNVKSLDSLIRELNADLKGPSAANRYGPLQVRARQAVIEQARATLDNTLENLGEKGVKDVNRRWGALGDVESRSRERAVQLARQEAKQGPLPEWVHAYSFLHPGHVIPTIGAGIRLSGLFKPNAGRMLNSGLRDLGQTNLSAPFAAEPPPGWGTPPRALLPPPATQLPGPGAAEVAHPEMFPRPNPGVEAQRQVYRDPASGRMQRGYTGQGRPIPVGHTAEGGPMYAPPEPVPQRAPRPEERRGVPQQYAGTERRSVRDLSGPDPMRGSLQRTLQGILDDPTATAHDKAVAQMQLDDLKAHPFDEPVGNRDLFREGRAKTEKKLTKAEAEAASEKRKAGRNKRFQGKQP